MESKKLNFFFELLFAIFLTLFFSTFSYAQFPQFSYEQSSITSNDLSVTGQISSGTQLTLSINGVLIDTQDIIAEGQTITLNGNIPSVAAIIGAPVYFKNSASEQIYQLNIPDHDEIVLNPGETSSEIIFQEEGSITYTDTQSGNSASISVTDELQEFTFELTQEQLQSTSNTLEFTIKYPTPTLTETQTETRTLSYDKYTNDITIDTYKEITKYNEVQINGSISDSDSKLKYILNNEGTIVNAGALYEIKTEGAKFNVTIQGLKEGNNSIRFITTEPDNENIFTGEKIISVFVDTIAPTIEIVNTTGVFEDEDFYSQTPSLKITLKSDALTLNYTLNNKTTSTKFDNGTAEITLSLKVGQNNLTLEAIDVAGNIGKIAHAIFMDNRKPTIDELEPEELFEGTGTAHFYLNNFEGKTNKANVDITYFTIPSGAKTSDGKSVSCTDYESLFVRNLGQLDNEDPDSVELNLNETQVSLLSLVSTPKTISSDGEGDFDGTLVLQTETFDSDEYSSASTTTTDNPEVGTVEARNTVCFILQDKFGNSNVYSHTIVLDTGNTLWKAGEVTTTPNTIYAAEIEQMDSAKSGTSGVEFGVIVKLTYLGGGTVTKISSFRIESDKKASEDSKYITIGTPQNYRFDKATNEMLVYFPVTVKARNIDVKDYPDKLNFAFAARITYDVNDNQSTIDTKNPIYFQTTVNVERPLDHAKWLSPENIDKAINLLNKSIKITEKIVEYLGYASIGGVLWCTGSNLYYSYLKTLTQDEDQKKEYQKNIFMACDRVACTASPPKCDDAGTTDLSVANLPEDERSGIIELTKGTDGKTQRTYKNTDQALSNAAIYTDEVDANGVQRKMVSFDSLTVGNACDSDGDGIKDGVYVTTDITTYNETTTAGIWKKEETSSKRIVNKCAEAFYESYTCGKDPVSYTDYQKKTAEEKKLCTPTGTPKRINLNTVSGMCFQEGYPKYDETRCNFFGQDENGVPGKDPAKNIFNSIRCGCITDTYSHMKGILKIQEALRGCLQQAKIGETDGSYCERLFSVAVCDVATNFIFDYWAEESNARKASDKTTDNHEENAFLATLKEAKEGDRVLNERYRGTFYSQLGLGTQSLANKVCVGAISGDWSALTTDILDSVDQNEVAPTFAPMFPTSRIQGYNPLTGKLSIRYTLSYAVVSGGQNIQTTLNFRCASDQPGGEYCPAGDNDAESLGSEIKQKTLTTRAGELSQDTVIIKDTNAKYWYNVVEVKHVYTLKGETKTETYTEKITHKSDTLPVNCYWDGGIYGTGNGISCDIFGTSSSDVAYYSLDSSRTKIVPTINGVRPTLYPGNKLLVDVFYYVQGGASESNLNLHWLAQCSDTSAQSYVSFTTDGAYSDTGNAAGHKVITLTSVPSTYSQSTSTKFATGTIETTADKDTKIGKLKVKLTATTTTTATGATSTTPTTLPAFNIQSIKIKDKAGNILTQTSSSVVLSQNNGEYSADMTSLRLSDSEKKNVVIEMTLDRGVTGVEFYLEINGVDQAFKITEKSEQDSQQTLDGVKAGSCTLKLRLLPSSVGAITKDEFDSYNLSSEDVITNVNVNEVVKKEFVLAFPPTSGEAFSFDIVEPYENKVVCSSNAGNLKIEVLGLSSANTETKKIGELVYSVTLERQKVNGGIEAGSITSSGATLSLSNYNLPSGVEKEKVTIVAKTTDGKTSVTRNFYFKNCVSEEENTN